jgi:hypothetical protein
MHYGLTLLFDFRPFVTFFYRCMLSLCVLYHFFLSLSSCSRSLRSVQRFCFSLATGPWPVHCSSVFYLVRLHAIPSFTLDILIPLARCSDPCFVRFNLSVDLYFAQNNVMTSNLCFSTSPNFAALPTNPPNSSSTHATVDNQHNSNLWFVFYLFNSLNSDLLMLDPANRSNQSISKFRLPSSTTLNHAGSTSSHSIFVSQNLYFSFPLLHSFLGQLYLTAMFLDVHNPPRFPYSWSVIQLHLFP